MDCINCRSRKDFQIFSQDRQVSICQNCESLGKLKKVNFSVPEKVNLSQCPICSTLSTDVLKTGLVGCPVCYELFADNIEELLVPGL